MASVAVTVSCMEMTEMRGTVSVQRGARGGNVVDDGRRTGLPPADMSSAENWPGTGRCPHGGQHVV